MQLTKTDLVKVLEGVNVVISDSDEDISIIELLEDSLHLVSTLVQLEQEFDIEFTDDELNGDVLVSVNQLLNVINEKLASKV